MYDNQPDMAVRAANTSVIHDRPLRVGDKPHAALNTPDLRLCRAVSVHVGAADFTGIEWHPRRAAYEVPSSRTTGDSTLTYRVQVLF